MYFDTLTDFFAMGGYGLFVWLSFGLTWLLLIILAAYSSYEQRQFKKQLLTRLAREQRVKQHQENETYATKT